MKLLKRIELKNFQSHKYTDIYFDDKVNVIIGSSDSGKTAIIRGMKWALFNEPSGNEFMRKGSNDTYVTLYFNNNLIIKRGRIKAKNYYEITLPGGNTERFEGFGKKVPQEIKEFTGIDKVKLDGDNLISLSISDQLESPFLLTETPSIKALAIGKIAGVETIDIALNKLSKDMREIETQKKSLEKEKKIQEEKLEKFDFLEKEKKELEYIEVILDKINSKKILLDKMKLLNNKICTINNDIDKTNLIIFKYRNNEQLNLIFKQINYKLDKYNISQEIFLKYEYLKLNILKYNKVLESTKNINDLFEKIINIENLNLKYVSLDTLYSKYSYINNNTLKLSNFIEKDTSVKLDDFYNKIIRLSNKYTKLNDIFYKLNIVNERINKGTIYINRFNNIKLVEINYNDILMLLEKLIQLYKYFKLYSQINNKLKSVQEDESKLSIDFSLLLKNYIDLLKELSICPYCYSELDQEHLNKIIEEYEI
ncbi:AAA family ATPase [Miniphocaeibacter massiliensis]|uniref:AAA family ATPase n=1 Tax=Miniphocaeibacter massiliensis TaxID=2041841 RepID=UPI000C071171|nr:AAA family ATPase [Miniphocaeibacter massiliensis]